MKKVSKNSKHNLEMESAPDEHIDGEKLVSNLLINKHTNNP